MGMSVRRFFSTIFFLSALSGASGAFAASAANFGAEIVDLSGPVRVVSHVTLEKMAAAKGMKLVPGDAVETGPAGEAEILYDDGNLSRLDENSRLGIEKLTMADGARETSLRLEIGRVKNAVSKLVSKHSRFEVHTKTATAGVVGTPPWTVGLGGDPSSPLTEVDLLGKAGDAGEVFVEGAGGTGRQVITTGMRSVVPFGAPPVTPFAIAPDRLQSLESKMRFTTPQERRDLKRKDLDKLTRGAEAPGTEPIAPAASAVPVAPVTPAAPTVATPVDGSVVAGIAGAVAKGAATAGALAAGAELAPAAAGAAAGAAALGAGAGVAAGVVSGGASVAAGIVAGGGKDGKESTETGEKQVLIKSEVAPLPQEIKEKEGKAASSTESRPPQGNNGLMLAGGGMHTLMLMEDGTVWACGLNNKGQLGDGTDDDREVPVQVKGAGGKWRLEGVVSIAAGYDFSFAVKSDGTLWAWGRNNKGQLGDGTDDDRETPVQVKGLGGKGRLEGIAAVAAGFRHAVALKKDGTVLAWGYNDGQLGDGTTKNRKGAVQVKGEDGEGNLDRIIAVAAGYSHSAALKSDGTVWTWGLNGKGQLGDGTDDDREVPVQVKNLDGVIAISSGANHMLALRKDGVVWAWGLNESAQLGDKSITNRFAPVAVKAFSGATAVAAGENHSAALKNDGTVWTWGNNAHGQLGIEIGTGTMRLTPSFVDGLKGIIAIGAGGGHTIVRASDGKLWAWGWNDDGQLGDGTEVNRIAPVLTGR